MLRSSATEGTAITRSRIPDDRPHSRLVPRSGLYGEPYTVSTPYVRLAIHEWRGVCFERLGALLPAFVIGLREGLEAALIVVIIATFLIKAGRQDTLRAMWTGVGVAALFCLAFGVALQVLDENLRSSSRSGWRP